jgi:phosphoribosyl-AMP cyclohydrolase
MSNLKNTNLEEGSELFLQFKKRDGLLPVAVQEQKTGEILMIASVNKEALDHSIKTKEATFWSTSRNELWIKGETSGNRMKIHEILIDCDQDALIYKVSLEVGGVCHTKTEEGSYRKSCFYRRIDSDGDKLTFK